MYESQVQKDKRGKIIQTNIFSGYIWIDLLLFVKI